MIDKVLFCSNSETFFEGFSDEDQMVCNHPFFNFLNKLFTAFTRIIKAHPPTVINIVVAFFPHGRQVN